MSDEDLTDAEKWRTHQAKVLLESMCVEIGHSVDMEAEDVYLIMSRDKSVMKCKECGAEWDVETIMLKNGRLRLRAFLQRGMGYISSYKCPVGCNEERNWRENICWSSILKKCD
jgi:hypothetical protein